MAFKLFDYVNPAGENSFKEWTEGLQVTQKAKLNEKLDKLAIHGDELHPQILSDTDTPGIQKIRVHGNVQLRPLLCKGPIDVDGEYTLLIGAKEVGFKLIPKGVEKKAKSRKVEVKLDPVNRRKDHERVS